MGNHVYKAWGEKREPPDLPVEILHDIFSRVEPVSLVRCAATSKLLRRNITDPAFLHQLRHNADGGFVPSLLVGMFLHHRDEAPRFVPVPQSTKLALALTPANDGKDNFGSSTYELLASRAGLVVFHRYRTGPNERTIMDLCVGSPVTSKYVFLPHATLFGHSHVLLPGDDDDGAGRSFRLLVLDRVARAQTFSSRTGVWGPITEPPTHLDLRYTFALARQSAVVIHGVAHWLCLHREDVSSKHYVVLALRVATGQVTVIEVPSQCLRWRRREVTGELLLVRSADGRLGLVVAETFGLSLWTLTKDSGSWARRLVATRTRLLQSVKLRCHPLNCVEIELECFGEASGTVVFRMNGAGILLLNLKTMEICQLTKDRGICWQLWCCPYEMDPVFVLAQMKSFEF